MALFSSSQVFTILLNLWRMANVNFWSGCMRSNNYHLSLITRPPGLSSDLFVFIFTNEKVSYKKHIRPEVKNFNFFLRNMWLPVTIPSKPTPVFPYYRPFWMLPSFNPYQSLPLISNWHQVFYQHIRYFFCEILYLQKLLFTRSPVTIVAGLFLTSACQV